MKFRSILTRFFVLMILTTVLIMAFLSSRIFTDTFQQYLRQEQQSKLENIVTQISNLTRNNETKLTNDQLLWYVENYHLHLRIEDMQGDVVSDINRLMRHKNENLVTSEYTLINSSSEKVGRLFVTYDYQNPALGNAVDSFYRQSFRVVILVCAIVTCLSIVVSYLFSKKITQPIEHLSEVIQKLRQKQFNVKAGGSKIMELQSLSNNINYLANTLQSQEMIRKDYAQDISHELRTPISNLQLYLEALEDGVLSLDEETLKTLKNSADQLQTITDNLKETFEEAITYAEPNFENINLSEQLHTILNSFEPRIKQSNLNLIRSIDENINYRTDKGLFQQIVSNLMTNAIKASDESSKNIRVSLNRTNESIILSVKDNGVGIAKKDLSRIFERFYRVDSSRNSKAGGKGLGLAIIKNIVLQLGGEISVSSRLGIGSTFIVEFPITN